MKDELSKQLKAILVFLVKMIRAFTKAVAMQNKKCKNCKNI